MNRGRASLASTLLAAAALSAIFASCSNEAADTQTADTGTYTVTGVMTLSKAASSGTWAVALMSDINDAEKIHSVSYVLGSISGLTYFIPFTLTDVPAGTYQLYGYCDVNGDDVPTSGTGDMEGAYSSNQSSHYIPTVENFKVGSGQNLSGATFEAFAF